MGLQTATIPCKGGLNLAATDIELLGLPNEAISLLNFESSKDGGYRRISGFTEWGAAPVPGAGEIRGIRTYRGGILAVRGDNLYHSFTGSTWTLVNTDAPAGSNNATVLAATPIPLTTASGRTVQMDVFDSDTEVHVYIGGVSGNPAHLLITGTSEPAAAYTYREVFADLNDLGNTALVGSEWLTIFDKQVILANTTDSPTSLIYSSFATTDLTAAQISAGFQPQEIYTGSTSGQISFKRPITGIAEHRENLYVFTDRTISKVVGLKEGNPVVVPIVDNIGCVSGSTIQEMGGDLVFLAPDGLRTVSQTERIDDVELGVLSRRIAPVTKDIMSKLDRLTFQSCVIREKNQYRLWYLDSAAEIVDQRGFLAAFAYDGATGGFRWDYSELRGWETTAVFAGEDLNGIEFFVNGDAAGLVHSFENGSSFNGTQIPWIYQTTYTDLGDIGVRKNIHDVFIKMKTEGAVTGQLAVLYDYLSTDTPQPEGYSLGELAETFVYGTGVYGTAVYGVSTKDNQKIFTEGSGFTVSLRISDIGQIDDPFLFESLQLNFTPSGRI